MVAKTDDVSIEHHYEIESSTGSSFIERQITASLRMFPHRGRKPKIGVFTSQFQPFDDVGKVSDSGLLHDE